MVCDLLCGKICEMFWRRPTFIVTTHIISHQFWRRHFSVEKKTPCPTLKPIYKLWQNTFDIIHIELKDSCQPHSTHFICQTLSRAPLFFSCIFSTEQTCIRSNSHRRCAHRFTFARSYIYWIYSTVRMTKRKSKARYRDERNVRYMFRKAEVVK